MVTRCKTNLSSCTSDCGIVKSIIEVADLPDVPAVVDVSNWVGMYGAGDKNRCVY